MNLHPSLLPCVLIVLGLGAASSSPAAAQSRPSFDCAKATTAAERLICSDEALGQLDRAIADQYEALRQTLSPESFATVREAQGKWLRWLQNCAPGRRVGGDKQSKEEALSCLSDGYTERQEALGISVLEAGALKLEARMRFRAGGKPYVIETDVYPWLTGTPAGKADAFNRHVGKALALPAPLAKDAALDAETPGAWTFRRGFEVHAFDERLVSIQIFNLHMGPIGHSWLSEYALAWDLERDRPIRPTDVFHVDPDWRQAVIGFAEKYLREESDTQDVDGLLAGADVERPENWLFGEDDAVLLLNHGERSAAAPSAEIVIPYEALASYLRPDSPLPLRKNSAD